MLVGADVSVASLAAGNPKSSSLYRHRARLTNYHNPFDNALSVFAVNHGHTWYFDDTHFLQDVYLTICGEIDRVSIPTRTKTRDGGLALRV